MSKVYCGIGKPSKGSKVGSMLDCAKKGQIRRYGMIKVDSKILKMASQSKPVSKEKMQVEIVNLGTKIKILIQKYKKEMSDLQIILDELEHLDFIEETECGEFGEICYFISSKGLQSLKHNKKSSYLSGSNAPISFISWFSVPPVMP